ncbi:hypothetical protein TPAR_04770 [Tolypocladium paradoxum]|uniref:Uncharacterized protein n=1 Tax=Tolypocladium paradoxum TaxID=94208 RepID=A0A2S4KXW1_9HYPO|nr:hypothetical protein TPAR_04770 [Tolypocladium paradoxum]
MSSKPGAEVDEFEPSGDEWMHHLNVAVWPQHERRRDETLRCAMPSAIDPRHQRGLQTRVEQSVHLSISKRDNPQAARGRRAASREPVIRVVSSRLVSRLVPVF